MNARVRGRERARLGTPDGLLLHGDCLDVLAELSPAERFDLAYVDPPFNTGTSHGRRNGRGERSRGERAYDDAWGGLDAFLAMLEPRLAAIARVLSDRGSLFLHLDHRTVHDAKVLADRVFGRAAFQGEIVWVPGNGARRRGGPSVSHQTLLVYAKGAMIWNDRDPALREPHAETSLRMHFGRTDSAGRRYRDRRIGGKTYRYYADEGRRLGSVWSDCPAMSANTPFSSETTGYPTQKPEALLERIVRAASTPKSRVLDPMCGSGTTLAVAARLGRSWVGIDQSPIAFEIAGRRLGLIGASTSAARGR
jgi:site-specific DNA-methyltransferase (adenine-specific)